MPSWLPDFIVILILVIIFAIPISYMIYSKVKKGHFGTCECGCAAAMKNRKLKRAFKKDFQSKKAKEKALKENKINNNCCCNKNSETNNDNKNE